MRKYEFVKTQAVRLNGRNTNIWTVYETIQNSRIHAGKVSGRTKKEAEENFWNRAEENLGNQQND